jgi:hypothetical protein
MKRIALARAERRRQAADELEFERDREAALREQIARLAAELEGPALDQEVFGRLTPEEVELVRPALEGGPAIGGGEEEWIDSDEPWRDEQSERDELEAEIERLELEIAASTRRQQAFEHYLEALGALDAEVFEARWSTAEPAPRGSGTVRLICVRVRDGLHETPERGEITVDDGLVGDRWATGKRDLDAQITLMNVRVADLIGGPLDLAGDNFQVDLDLSEEALPVGTRLRIGTALLEVSPVPHTGCKKFRERFGLEALTWVNDHRDRRLRGMNCRVVESGEVSVGDLVEVV